METFHLKIAHFANTRVSLHRLSTVPEVGTFHNSGSGRGSLQLNSHTGLDCIAFDGVSLGSKASV
eukprot:3199920-Amphidinium_carterae.2